MIELGPDEARRAALWAAGLVDADRTPGSVRRASPKRQALAVRDLLGRLGAVQLDTISVLARSHELVAYARLGALPRSAIEHAYWGEGTSFEYWSHAACILPMDAWPLFAFRRRHYRAKGERWHGVPQADLDALRATIRERGPITTSDVGGAKVGGEWWDWSASKIGLEWLLDVGEIVVTKRVGWRRSYDLTERAVPEHLRHDELTDASCHAALVEAGARLMGVGTAGDIADVHRLPRAAVGRHAEEAGLVPVRVEGWPRTWAHPTALSYLEGAGRARHRTTLLSPFDPLVWYRDRAERLFGMRHRIEAYTPAAKRVHGYFAMPVLHGGRLVARVDPKRDGTVLRARRVTFESTSRAAVAGTARALAEAATWVECGRVIVDEAAPAALHRVLQAQVEEAAGG